MMSHWWKLRLALLVVLSIIQRSKTRAAPVIIKDADESLTGVGDDLWLRSELTPSTDRDSRSRTNVRNRMVHS